MSPCWRHNHVLMQDASLWKSGEFHPRFSKGYRSPASSEASHRHASVNAFWSHLMACWWTSWPYRQCHQHSASIRIFGSHFNHLLIDDFKQLSYQCSFCYCHSNLLGTHTCQSRRPRPVFHAMPWPRTRDRDLSNLEPYTSHLRLGCRIRRPPYRSEHGI